MSLFFFSSRRRHTRLQGDWSSDVCSSDLALTTTEIAWPPQGGGPATGGCAVYVGADRAGNVRESWPGGCDSTGIQTALRDIVKTWKLRVPISNGVPVQVEALLGFTFHTEV